MPAFRFSTADSKSVRYSSLSALCGGLDGLNPKDVANLDKARQNVEEFAVELLVKLAIKAGAAASASSVSIRSDFRKLRHRLM